MGGVHHQGREHGEDAAAEDPRQRRALDVTALPPPDHRPAGRQRRVHGRLPGRDGRHPAADLLQPPGQAPPIGPGGAHPAGQLLLQPGHPHLVELVEPLGQQHDIADPLGYRHPVVLGQLQDPLGVVQPRQLAVGIPVGRELGAAGMLHTGACYRWPERPR